MATTRLTPDITEAVVVRHGVLHLTFTDGLAGEVEVLDWMRGLVFDEARTPYGFAKVTVDRETGTVVRPEALTSLLTLSTSASAPALGRTKT